MSLDVKAYDEHKYKDLDQNKKLFNIDEFFGFPTYSVW